MWKDIYGYEGLYQVNEEGFVKRLESFRKNGSSGYIQKEKILKQTTRNKGGYVCVNLSKNGKAKVISVHRLVAETFIENPENKTQINHKNGNKKDNRIINLEWVTPKENINHCDEVLGRKRNKEGLKLGSIATTKNNLNIKNGEKIFQTYKEIKSFLEEKLEKKISLKQVQQNIRSCCKKERKTAFGMYWEYVK